jgi:hypothetical protein
MGGYYASISVLVLVGGGVLLLSEGISSVKVVLRFLPLWSTIIRAALIGRIKSSAFVSDQKRVELFFE